MSEKAYDQLKRQIVDYLLEQKRADYHRLFEAQQDDLDMAEDKMEDEQDLYEKGKIDQAINRIEAKSSALESLTAEIQLLENIDEIASTPEVQIGDIIETNHGDFFVAVPATAFTIDGREFRGISADSPLFEALKGAHNGDSVQVRDITYVLKNSY